MVVLAPGSHPENPRAAASAAPTPPSRRLPHAPAALRCLCASLPASALRFRPATLSFRFSMVCGKTSLSRRKWLASRDGSGFRAVRSAPGPRGRSEGRGWVLWDRGADLREGVPRLGADPSSPCALSGIPSRLAPRAPSLQVKTLAAAASNPTW